MGFFAALAPLIIAAFFTLDTLDKLAIDNLESASLLVDMTRLAQDIESDLVELERRAGHYYALVDASIADLFTRQQAALLLKLRDLDHRIQLEGPEISQLIESIENLELVDMGATDQVSMSKEVSAGERLATVFQLIGEQGNLVQTRLESYVDKLLERNAFDAREAIDRLAVQMVFFSLSTLLLLLIFSYWISRPVRQLTDEIHQLGTQGLAKSIEISGPGELRQLGGKLEWLRQQLQEAEQKEQSFVRHISHEL